MNQKLEVVPSDITKFKDKDTFCCNKTKEYNIRVLACAVSISTVLLTIIPGMYTDLIIEISNLYFFSLNHQSIFFALMQDPSVQRNNWIFPTQTNNHLHLFWVETCYNAPTPTLTDNGKKSFHSIEQWTLLEFFQAAHIIAVITCFCYILMILLECKKISCFH